MIFLGAITQGQEHLVKDLHFFNAVLAFGALYFGTWTFCIHMLKKDEFKKRAIVMTILAFSTTVGLAITQIFRVLAIPSNMETPWFLDFSFWEWNLLFGVFGAYVLLLFNLPKDDE